MAGGILEIYGVGNVDAITFGMYVAGVVIAILAVLLMRNTTQKGETPPFIMELPAYHMPGFKNLMLHLWDKAKHFVKKAFTIIFASTVIIWLLQSFSWNWEFLLEEVDGVDGLVNLRTNESILGSIGMFIQPIFTPLGFGSQLGTLGWVFAAAAITGLVAKENIVGTLGILYGGGDGTVYQVMGASFTQLTGMSFLIFNLLCAPCFAAMGAIKREMNNTKWFWFAIGYECGFAYVIALIVNQFGNLFTGNMNSAVNVISLIVAIALLVFMIYMLFKPYKESDKLEMSVKAAKKATV
jgi:ferrous iron transport protein B